MKNKVIIVTGGSGLIGKAIVKDLTKKGADVINFDLLPSSNNENFIKCDITNDDSLVKVLNTTIKKYKKIDGLVNNAYPRTSDWGKARFENISKESWRTNIDFQLNSYAFMTQEVVKVMLKQGFGSIVNIASIYGIVANDFSIYEGTRMNPSAIYSAIKGGLITLTKFLASYYGKYGVRVNCVSPGGVFDNQEEKFVKAYESRVPLKRMGNPDDIAPSVTFLLSDEAKYITGHNLIIDGGWTII